MVSYVTYEEFQNILPKMFLSFEVTDKTRIKDLTEQDIELLLERATRLVDAQHYIGRKVGEYKQELQFPRLIPHNTGIPQAIKNCVVELVFNFCEQPKGMHQSLISQGVKKLTTIETTVEFHDSVFVSDDYKYFETIQKHLDPYLYKTSGGY